MGLNDQEVIINRQKYGANIINNKSSNSFFHLLIESLGDPIIKILLIALGIKLLFLFNSFDWYETIGIVIAILLASFISAISEYGSNKAFDHLQSENEKYKVLVYRNKKLESIDNTSVVVGDVVKLESGMKVPADGKLIEGNLTLDEAFMSGEAKEINKQINDKVYSGSLIYQGRGLLLVDAVGKNTYMGNIAIQLSDTKEDSPLKKKLRVLAKQISIIGYIGAFLASLAYLFVKIVYNNHFDINFIMITLTNKKEMIEYLIYSLTLCVTIIIMAVPEGLPMMITLVLSSNMKKMLKDKILVRRLVGIETSGSLNLLLCDKTGTLTEGKLKVRLCAFNDLDTDNLNVLNNKMKDIVYKSFILNNEAVYINNIIEGGNTSDKAILEYVGNIKLKDKIIERKCFDSNDKFSYVLVDDYYYIKGASEKILPFCKSYLASDGIIKDLDINIINKKKETFTKKGYRVLTCAYGTNLDNLTFICFIVLADQIRKETIDSIKMIKNAGIHVVMITGDDKQTACTIGNEIGLINENSLILTHNELINMSDIELKEKLDNIDIIARSLPKDKARIVMIAKEKGLVVGMTGDGVNDALALKKSDVAFAMGSGADVAKEASDIIILDNNILSICKSILYGRTIFKSIRKFIIYQLTVNICALLLSIVGILIGINTPITIVQMLWINMIMDTFAGLAFSYEPALKEYMLEKPKSLNEKIMNLYMINQIVFNGTFSFIICILFLKLPIINRFIRTDKIMTAFFALFIFLGIINSFLSRASSKNIFKNILLNKVFIIINLFIFIVQIIIVYFGGDLFRAYGLNIKELLFTFIISLLIIPVDILRKYFLKKRKKLTSV